MSAKGAETNIDVEVAPIDAVGSVQGYTGLSWAADQRNEVLPSSKSFSAQSRGSNIPPTFFIISYLFERGRNFWKNAFRKNVESIRTLAGASSVEYIRRKAPRTSARLCAASFSARRRTSARHARLGQDEAWRGIAGGMVESTATTPVS
jgi:hypothetical protein